MLSLLMLLMLRISKSKEVVGRSCSPLLDNAAMSYYELQLQLMLLLMLLMLRRCCRCQCSTVPSSFQLLLLLSVEEEEESCWNLKQQRSRPNSNCPKRDASSCRVYDACSLRDFSSQEVLLERVFLHKTSNCFLQECVSFTPSTAHCTPTRD